MHRTAVGIAIAVALASGNHADAAEKLRFAYAVQVHQANMMVLGEYARKHGIELEAVPMRRYADIQLALMTNQIDAAVLGYVNVGLMEEKRFRDYRAIAGVFTGGFGITLANGVAAATWKSLEGLKLGTAPNSLSDLLFKSTASLGGADLGKIQLVSFTTCGPPMLAALKSREIDGFICWEPNNAEAALGKYGYYSSLDITASTRGINGMIAVNTTYLQSKRAVVVNFVRAVIDATKALNSDLDRYTKVAVQGTGSGPDVVREAIPRGALDYNLYAKEAKVLLQLVYEAKITGIDTSPAVDSQFDYSALMEATGETRAQLGGQ
ncbi:MAG TPA: ABC transporter substrate-binding protein [Xanthobacteraceae bacterium]|jgi:ABC-type nitrate/sulfonate/bicarbonate transport system substrate-binding protein